MKNVAHINTNEIIESNNHSLLTNFEIKYNIENSILIDYARGIKKAKLTIIPSNYYYNNGTLAINWENGDIPQVNQIIRVLNKEGTAYLKDRDNNDVLFRIVDRKVRYEGQIFIDLDLQEIARININN